VVLRGIPVDEVCLAAETYKPRFLVIGSHGWGVVKRAIFGSVSTGVLHRARCPVLVVRADPDEVTPRANGRHSVRVA
jgi:nucleotide-binding universal stress UspA family protein